MRADKLLVDIDEILGSCGIEGVGSIGYVSLEPQISKIYEDVLVLANYPSELTFEFSSVDDDFAHDVQDAVNALSTIKIDDIRIKNEFGVTYTEESFDGFEYVYETRMKDSISLTDFIGGGYTGLRREETTFVEGFTDVIYSRFVTDDKDLKTIIAEKSKEIDSILHGAEFNAASYQPAKEMLSSTLEIASMGIYPLMECVAGYDLITKEILTDDEMGRLMFMMGLELTFVPLMMGKGFAQFFINLAASAGGAVTSVTTAKLCEEMGATELQTFLISSLVGLAAGYALHCSGESVYEFYKQHKNEIASNMAKNASDNVGSLVEEMVDDVDDLAVESQYKSTDTLLKPSGVLDDAADDLAVKTQSINSDNAVSKLSPGEGAIGTYKDLVKAGKRGDNLTPHHMPSAEYMLRKGVASNEGLCMNMEMPVPGVGGRHRLTNTYGGNMTDAEKAFYYSLSPRDALAYDINNVRKIYQNDGLYYVIRPQLKEYIKTYKSIMPELFEK